MHTQNVSYEDRGLALTGYLARPDYPGIDRPGVLLCHQGMGLTEHTCERARMVAELGYVAFALDLYGEVARSREDVTRLMGALTRDPDLLGARADAGVKVLKSLVDVDPSRLAAIGFCFGGGVVLELARLRNDLAAVVAFHPGLMDLPDQDDRPIQARVMVCAGHNDPLIPASARERLIKLMSDHNADWQLLTFGQAGHAFTDTTVDAFGMEGFSYHRPTDVRSWSAMQALLEESFHPVDQA